jgi:hypothetical protein
MNSPGGINTSFIPMLLVNSTGVPRDWLNSFRVPTDSSCEKGATSIVGSAFVAGDSRGGSPESEGVCRKAIVNRAVNADSRRIIIPSFTDGVPGPGTQPSEYHGYARGASFLRGEWWRDSMTVASENSWSEMLWSTGPDRHAHANQNDGVTVVVEPHSERHRFHFSIRKLMLWTVVLAMWFGVLATLPLGPPLSMILTFWVVVVAVVRVAIRPLAAALTSAVIAFGVALIHDYYGLLYYDDLHPPYMFIFPPAFGLYAVVVFAFVEFALRAANWVDNLGDSHD